MWAIKGFPTVQQTVHLSYRVSFSFTSKYICHLPWLIIHKEHETENVLKSVQDVLWIFQCFHFPATPLNPYSFHPYEHSLIPPSRLSVTFLPPHPSVYPSIPLHIKHIWFSSGPRVSPQRSEGVNGRLVFLLLRPPPSFLSFPVTGQVHYRGLLTLFKLVWFIIISWSPQEP